MVVGHSTYDHGGSPEKDDRGKEVARSHFTNHDDGGGLKDRIGDEEDDVNGGIGIVLSVHVEISLHSGRNYPCQ